jgi:LysM repeat protein
MRFYLIFLSGLFFLILPNCQEQPEIIEQSRTAVVTRSPTPEIGVTLETLTTPVVVTEEKITPVETPSPTITLTPTPTPFIYIVVEGDTLFDIAARHGTTIEAILALNPGLQPELLSIGQELILPEQVRPDPTATSGTANQSSIVISGLVAYRTPTNGIWILGELTNQGGQDLENVQVTVTLLDDAGQSVQEDNIWPATNIIEAGNKAPFGTLVIPAPSVDVSPDAIVVSADPIIDLGNRYLDFEVANVEAEINGGQAMIIGEIVNTGDKNATEIALIVTLYDGEGNVTGYQKSYLDEPLVSGSTTPFEIHVLPPGDMIHDYAFLVQGLVDPPENPE